MRFHRFIEALEHFVGHDDFDFNTPRSENRLVVNTRRFSLPIYSKNTKVIYRFSENLPPELCTPYPEGLNPDIVFEGQPVLATDINLDNIEFYISDGKLIVPRLIFIKKLLNMSELSAYYYMYKQQLLTDFINN